MTQIQKATILHTLYHYKALGYEYIDEIKPKIKPSTSLPNSLDKMQSFISSCHLCDLAKSRKNIVFGEGNINADLMFVGDVPSASEDSMAKAFVGRSGELLNKIIQNVLGLKREDVYLTNIVKCRSQNDKALTNEQIHACVGYVLQQINIIKPKIIVALGSTSFQALSQQHLINIQKARGQIFTCNNAKLIPTFHPSYLLRNPSAKKLVYQDMLKVKGLL